MQRIRLTLLFILALAPVPVMGQSASLFGVWELNAGKSTQRDTSPYKRTTLTIEPWDEGVQVSYDMVGTRGGRTHLEWRGRFDGRDYAVQGLDYVMTNAYEATAEDSWQIVVKLDGRAVATTAVSISPDGRVMRAVTNERDAVGAIVTSTSVYDKTR